ncbi:DUF4920 domain-containing protein [Aquimarina sp. 2201CG1-2-11]|uniref:DUF4920 domain-containing protein n=1 Tax=Aquimarina discodermiae TaxID=3231043 RepID=UPI003462DFE7
MKKMIVCFVGGLLLIGCSMSTKKKEFFNLSDISKDEYVSYGDEITLGNINYSSVMRDIYKDMNAGDTIDVVFRSVVNSVCKAKGCWMKVNIGDEDEVMIKFKDYGFFVPKDIESDTVIIKGKAFVNELSIDEQRHLALDAQKSKEQINAITTLQKTYSFLADAVLIKK